MNPGATAADLAELEAWLGQPIHAGERQRGVSRPMLGAMTVLRLDNIGIVVDDLAAAIAFFKELGLELEGKTSVEGPWVDQTVGLTGVRADIAMMRTPDGHSRLELTRYNSPPLVEAEPRRAPPNMLGVRKLMFAVDDLEDVVARLGKHGGELVGEIARYEDMYLLCYLRGPGDMFVALAQELE
jgi:catechol 2,3-dioxygenase-like lactoylglutathione lyase family enzyme